VGYALVSGVRHASLWTGGAASWVDLNQYMPGNYSQATALGVWATDGYLNISGVAMNTSIGREEAVLWKFRRCTADFNDDSVVDFFDYLDFVQAFSSEDPAADFNHDDVIDFFDYLDFVDAFSGGC
jgi:hypothetical protein